MLAEIGVETDDHGVQVSIVRLEHLQHLDALVRAHINKVLRVLRVGRLEARQSAVEKFLAIGLMVVAHLVLAVVREARASIA